MVDYSRWDRLDVGSDSEGDDDDVDDVSDSSGRRGCRTAHASSQYVQLHADDDVADLNPLVLSDPRTHVAAPDARGLRVAWGLANDPERYGGVAAVRRRMLTQRLYAQQRPPPPEEQFVARLQTLKQARVLAERPARMPLLARDFVLDVELLMGLPSSLPFRVWRRVKVAGKTRLDALHERVLVPLLGWARDRHGYVLCDQTDGAVFGPAECSLPDMRHVVRHGLDFLPSDEYGVADLVCKPGERFVWTYDLGAAWTHVATLVEIRELGESDGKTVCLDGAGACPPEDSVACHGMGPAAYAKTLSEVLLALPEDDPRRVQTIKAMSQAANHKQDPNGFDPRRFSCKDANERIHQEELLGPAEKPAPPSSSSSAAAATDPLVRVIRKKKEKEPEPAVSEATTTTTATTQEPVQAPAEKPKKPEPPGFLPGVDKRPICCAQCGKSPQKLSRCSRCKETLYCSRECQAAHWPVHRITCIDHARKSEKKK